MSAAEQLVALRSRLDDLLAEKAALEAEIRDLTRLINDGPPAQSIDDILKRLIEELDRIELFIEHHDAEPHGEAVEPCMVLLADGSRMDVYELRRKLEETLQAVLQMEEFAKADNGG